MRASKTPKVVWLVAVAVLSSCADPLPEDERVLKKEHALYAPTACSSTSATVVSASVTTQRWQPFHWPTMPTQNYANRISTPYWGLLFNQNVRYLWLEFDRFAVADAGDQLTLLHATGAQTWSFGTPTGTKGPYAVRANQGASYAHLRWQTNNNGVALGYSIPNVRVMCTGSPASPGNTVYVHPNHQYDGFLIDTDDVIWVYTVQPAGKELSIYLDPVDEGISANADFDLYVSTDPTSKTPPTSGSPPSAQISNIGGADPEMVLLPAPSTSRNVYIGIVSWQGAGRFRFNANVIEPNHQDTINVYTDFSPTVHHRQVVRNSLRKLAAAVYFGTDGRHLIREFKVTYNFSGTRVDPSIVYLGINSDGRNYCFGGTASVCTTVHPTNPHTYISYRANHWCGNGCQPTTNPTCTCTNTDAHHEAFAMSDGLHEYGHCFLGLPDEDPAQHPDGETCGHSLMNNGRVAGQTQNRADFCTERAGGHDPDPGTTGHPASENNWDCIEQSYSGTPEMNSDLSPDPYWQGGRIGVSDYPFSRYLTINETN